MRPDIPEVAEVRAGVNGLPLVRVTSPHAQGEMYLHGAHVTSWVPAGQREVLFVSRRARYEPGRAIRGGIPVCFPWFGALDGRPDAPAHGCVRTAAWDLEAIESTDAGVVVTMATSSGEHTGRYWPGEFRLVHRVSFGASLTLELSVTNTGLASFTFEEALHTYYRVESIRDVGIRGLEGARYLDSLDANRELVQPGTVEFGGEVDRVYLGTADPILIDDHGWPRRIGVSAEPSMTTIVWNPWIRKAQVLADLGDDEWQEFVCVESANVQPRPVALAPGETHEMRVIVRLA